MKLPLLSVREVLAALNRMEFKEVHRKGSHVKMKHPDGRKIVIPYHDEVEGFLQYLLRTAFLILSLFLLHQILQGRKLYEEQNKVHRRTNG